MRGWIAARSLRVPRRSRMQKTPRGGRPRGAQNNGRLKETGGAPCTRARLRVFRYFFTTTGLADVDAETGVTTAEFAAPGGATLPDVAAAAVFDAAPTVSPSASRR